MCARVACSRRAPPRVPAPLHARTHPQTKTDLGNAGIAAVVGAIAARVAMGNFVDIYGPRFGISLCIGLTAPAVYCIGMSTSAAGFIVSRLFIGFSLATFVACQFWCTSMFNTKVVGTANAFAAGWGNMVSAHLQAGGRKP
jgi:NNP family nitrate/nitrite transporter-like MFS transporter